MGVDALRRGTRAPSRIPREVASRVSVAPVTRARVSHWRRGGSGEDSSFCELQALWLHLHTVSTIQRYGMVVCFLSVTVDDIRNREVVKMICRAR